MERLTIKYCGEFVPKDMCRIDRLGRADDCDLCCEYCKATKEGNADCIGCAISQSFNRLGEYEDLEEQGKLLKLPCAVGDNIYIILGTKEIEERKAVGFKMIPKGWVVEVSNWFYLFEEFGKTVFLTRKEAEAALKEAERLRGYRSAGGSRSDEGGKGTWQS